MGIQGLIPFLEKSSKPTNVKEFSGGTVAIDAYCWLHKGVFSCADKLARGDSCDLYVAYCMKFINMLLSYNIKPILVFDGQKLPAKMDTEKKRKELREQNRKKAAELMRLDRGKEAQTYLRRCIDISHEMALNLIRICRSRNVDCIVAPYEADAQLAFLNIQNVADVVITEDSDLLLFGAKKVLFKMDINGNGLLIEQEKLYLALGVKEEDFSFDKFRYMCILSGCDYLSSLPGIGLVKACRFIKKTVDPDIYRSISRLSLHLNMPQLTVTKEYKDKFMDANFMFKYQPVYDPRKRKLVPLTEVSDDDENYKKFLDLISINNLSEDQVNNLAYGNLDPFSLSEMDNWSPSPHSRTPVIPHTKTKGGWNAPAVAAHPSIWSPDFVPNSWNSSSKSQSAPPNALCPVAKKTSLEIPQSSPKMPCDSHSNLPTKQEVTEENMKKQMDQLRSAYHVENEKKTDELEESAISTSVTKKTHHNPWTKNSATLQPSNTKNVNALSKMARLFKVTENERNVDSNIVSRYFSGSTANSLDSPLSTHENNSILTPDSSGSPSSLDVSEPKSVSCSDTNQRSPLKTLNGSDVPYISNACSPSKSPVKQTVNDDDFTKSPCASRKRVNPFAVSMPQEKKSCASGSFIERLNSFKKSGSSSFAWSPKAPSPKKDVSLPTVTTAATANFKTPRTEPEESEKADSGIRAADVDLGVCAKKILSQSDDVDEGFCSPNSNNSGSYDDSVGGDSTSPVFPTNRKTSTSCRISGLKKPARQLSILNMFAHKDPPKIKSRRSVR